LKSAIKRSLGTRSSRNIAEAHPRTIIIPRIEQLKDTNQAVLSISQLLLPKNVRSLLQDRPPFPDHVYRQGGEYLAREYLMRFPAARKSSACTRKRSNSLSLDIMKDIGLNRHRKKQVYFKPEPIVPKKSSKPWKPPIGTVWNPDLKSRKRKRGATGSLSKNKPIGVLTVPVRFEDLSHSLITNELLRANPVVSHPATISLDSHFYIREESCQNDFQELYKRALKYLDHHRPMEAYPDKEDWEIREQLIQGEEGTFFGTIGEFFGFS
jgi:hypothetical protein